MPRCAVGRQRCSSSRQPVARAMSSPGWCAASWTAAAHDCLTQQLPAQACRSPPALACAMSSRMVRRSTLVWAKRCGQAGQRGEVSGQAGWSGEDSKVSGRVSGQGDRLGEGCWASGAPPARASAPIHGRTTSAPAPAHTRTARTAFPGTHLDALHHGGRQRAGLGLVEGGRQPGVAQRLLGARPLGVVLRQAGRGRGKGEEGERERGEGGSQPGVAQRLLGVVLRRAERIGRQAVECTTCRHLGAQAAQQACALITSTGHAPYQKSLRKVLGLARPVHPLHTHTHTHTHTLPATKACLVQQRLHKVLGLVRHLLPRAAPEGRLLREDALPDDCGCRWYVGGEVGGGGSAQESGERSRAGGSVRMPFQMTAE